MKQEQALHLMKQGESVFLTGAAGSGKTFILNKLIEQLKKQKKIVAVTASTGIAATHLGGVTIHSWSGLGIRDELTKKDIRWLEGNARLQKRYNTTEVLIIDEVSMLHGKRLDMINQACKLLRGSDEPFGGLQLILTGDLFQLPPINRDMEVADFVHTSDAWRELEPKVCYLMENFRQENGDLLELLSAMRSADIRRRHLTHLQNRLNINAPTDKVLTRLFSHNVDVERINQQHLDSLDSELHAYNMSSEGRKSYIEVLQKSVLAPNRLELKVGAEVMFVANNFAEGFANGTRGTVINFDEESGLPIVKLQNKKRSIIVGRHDWKREEDGKIRASVRQLPLRLAWAITIHKSQGMSLDSALIDLSQTFTYGMGYVALSRVRSLDGLYLSGLNAMALKLHPDIHELDHELKTQSLEVAKKIGEVPVEEEVIEKPKKVKTSYDKELFEKLRSWRFDRAKKEEKPAFIIAHDQTLQELARRKPSNEKQLMAVHGFGPKKITAYGEDILNIINAQTKNDSK